MHYTHVYDEPTGLIALAATDAAGYGWTAVLDFGEFGRVVDVAEVLEHCGVPRGGPDDLRWAVGWVTGRDPASR